MAQQTIDVGTTPNDGTGDYIRDAFIKANDNFTELYASVAAAGASWKTPVRVATTSAKVLASEVENGDTIDGVVIATGDRVLLKNQTAPAENGIYVVAASGAPTRATDADSSAELVNAAVLVSEGTTNADKLFVCTTNAPITVGTTALTWADFTPSGSSSVGAHQIYIPAGAMRIRTTNGAAAGSAETTTNKIMVDSLDFDQSTQEYAQFGMAMPKSWDEGTVTAFFVWTTTAASGAVVWGIQAVARGDGDAIDAAWGTAQEVTDTCLGADLSHHTSATSAITIAGTPAEGDRVTFQVYRKAADGADTLAADAKLLGVMLTITTNAATDA